MSRASQFVAQQLDARHDSGGRGPRLPEVCIEKNSNETGETTLKRLIATGLLLTGQAVWADWPPANYSVELVYTGPSGVSRIDKFFVAEGKRRIESKPSRGEAFTSIERPDKGVTWLVFDARKNCMEMA